MPRAAPERIIQRGEWDYYISRIMAATPEQCRNWTYLTA